VRNRLPLAGIMSVAIVALCSGMASAQAQDPGGQQNQQWGNVASNLAKETDPDVTGGGMGAHSRSTKAANKNGGFAADGNGFGISFNVKEDGGNAGRTGVGNVSKGAPHNTHPGDGGNGVHAVNNANAAGTLDPVTGEPVGAGGEDRDLLD
jgi:hypothetical protein